MAPTLGLVWKGGAKDGKESTAEDDAPAAAAASTSTSTSNTSTYTCTPGQHHQQHLHQTASGVNEIQLYRLRMGECPNCGIRTHELREGPAGSTHRVSLTNENVLDGRCLLCNPIQRPNNTAVAGKLEAVKDEGDATDDVVVEAVIPGERKTRSQVPLLPKNEPEDLPSGYRNCPVCGRGGLWQDACKTVQCRNEAHKLVGKPQILRFCIFCKKQCEPGSDYVICDCPLWNSSENREMVHAQLQQPVDLCDSEDEEDEEVASESHVGATVPLSKESSDTTSKSNAIPPSKRLKRIQTEHVGGEGEEVDDKAFRFHPRPLEEEGDAQPGSIDEVEAPAIVAADPNVADAPPTPMELEPSKPSPAVPKSAGDPTNEASGNEKEGGVEEKKSEPENGGDAPCDETKTPASQPDDDTKTAEESDDRDDMASPAAKPASTKGPSPRDAGVVAAAEVIDALDGVKNGRSPAPFARKEEANHPWPSVEGMLALGPWPSPPKSKAQEKVERKRAYDRNQQKKTRKRKHYDRVEKTLNKSEMPYPRNASYEIKWMASPILGLGKVPEQSLLEWKKGFRRSEVGNICDYGAQENIEEAVIVLPQGPNAERIVVDANRIEKTPPLPCVVKLGFQEEETRAEMLTGMFFDAEYWEKICLVRYPENGELWWLTESFVEPGQVCEERKVSQGIDPPMVSGLDKDHVKRALANAEEEIRQKKSSGCIEEATAAGIAKCKGSKEWKNPNIFVLVRADMLFKLLKGGFEEEGIQAHWNISQETRAKMKLPQLADAFEESTIGTWPEPPLIRERLCSFRSTPIGNESWYKLVYGEPRHRVGRREQKGKEKKKKAVVKPTCRKDGCESFAHTATKLKYCMKHFNKADRKMCRKCIKREARRKGGLCSQCYEVPESDSAKYCQYCLPFGFKNEPRKAGGMCANCIANGVKRDRKCIRCNQSLRKRKGKLCYKCYHEDVRNNK